MNASVSIGYKWHLPAINSPWTLLGLQIAAFWHLWYWFGVRSVTSSDGVWEVLPLISVLFFSWRAQAEESPIGSSALLSSAALLVLYSASFAAYPFTARAIIALASITFIISRWRFGTTFHFGIFTLFLLSLPLTDSLNFFLGYPMRVVVGESVVFLLNLQGLDVYREGVGLHFGETLIWIDAPCSGAKMLWFGSFLATFMSCLLNLTTVRLLAALCLAFASIMMGNIMRASALFYIEGGLIKSPAWMHSAVGVVAFVLTSLAIVFIVRRLSATKW